ncbi:MAG: NrdJb [Proteobacteria bacterium]|nr:NrdJb [Pseudomonadota bacterium]
MTIKIGKKISGYSVVKPEDKAAAAAPVVEPIDEAAGIAPIGMAMAEVIQLHERVERPEVLVGSTYKIKSPLVEHAMYVTINDIVLNYGTEHEQRRPFEVFINSKSMDHFQWIVALTRIMSAVFRKGGDVTFLVEEMKAVFDPRGGYFKAGGVYMPSIVAEIGAVVEEHLKSIGMIVSEDLSEAQRRLIAEKRAAYEARAKKNSENQPLSDTPSGIAAAGEMGGAMVVSAQSGNGDGVRVTGEGTSFPPSAAMCHKCSTKAVVILDGCATCLNCGYSKCGG